MAAVKETNFFHYGSIEGRLPEYEAHFEGAAGAVAVGEISTRYLGSHRAPARARDLIPRARLFVSLRNPIDQVYSHYWHLRRQNFHQWTAEPASLSFEQALARFEDRLLEPVRYLDHIQRWLGYFDRSQLLILFFDDIRERPRAVLETLFAFVNVDSRFVPVSLHDSGSSVRRGVSPRGTVSRRLHARAFELLNRWIYRPAKRVVGVRRAVRTKDALLARQVLERLFLRTGYPEMNADTRRSLVQRFSGDIQALSRLTGRNLNEWLR